jgi:hypothetical protein
MRGEPVVRDNGEEEPPADHGAKSSVPTTDEGMSGKTSGGFEPEPQPGS